MTVEAIGARIKVLLTVEDLNGLGLSFETMDCAKLQTRIVLRSLFKAAAATLGQSAPCERLLIEAYPHLDGGGVLYFTPLMPHTNKRLKLKPAIQEFAYDFTSGDSLLAAIEQLYSHEETRHLKSLLYDVDGVFRLVIKGDESNNRIFFIKEFCDSFSPFERLKKYTCEHGKLLAGDNAIIEIGGNITKVSLGP